MHIDSPQVTAPRYYIAQSTEFCRKCGELTQIVGLLLPPEARILDVGDNEGEASEQRFQDYFFIYHVTQLSEPVQQRLRVFAPHYRFDSSQEWPPAIWMNHCEFCDYQVSDFDLYRDEEAMFNPKQADEIIDIRVAAVEEAFAGAAGRFLPTAFFDSFEPAEPD